MSAATWPTRASCSAAYEMVEEVLLDGSYEVDEEITAS
jgi:hypothetical protein